MDQADPSKEVGAAMALWLRREFHDMSHLVARLHHVIAYACDAAGDNGDNLRSMAQNNFVALDKRFSRLGRDLSALERFYGNGGLKDYCLGMARILSGELNDIGAGASLPPAEVFARQPGSVSALAAASDAFRRLALRRSREGAAVALSAVTTDARSAVIRIGAAPEDLAIFAGSLGANINPESYDDRWLSERTRLVMLVCGTKTFSFSQLEPGILEISVPQKPSLASCTNNQG